MPVEGVQRTTWDENNWNWKSSYFLELWRGLVEQTFSSVPVSMVTLRSLGRIVIAWRRSETVKRKKVPCSETSWICNLWNIYSDVETNLYRILLNPSLTLLFLCCTRRNPLNSIPSMNNSGLSNNKDIVSGRGGLRCLIKQQLQRENIPSLTITRSRAMIRPSWCIGSCRIKNSTKIPKHGYH